MIYLQRGRTGSTRSNVFSFRKLVGILDDFGVLLPFTIGSFLISKSTQSSLLLGTGAVKIQLTLIYKLPLPVQQIK